MTKLVIVISTPRSGTSRLLNEFKFYNNVFVNGEFFNPNWQATYGRRHAFVHYLKERINFLAVCNDEKFFNWIYFNPFKVTKNMIKFGQCNNKEIIVLKIFRNDISFFALMLLSITRKPFYIFIHRDPLSSFISEIKARRVGKWGGIDTTEVRPKIFYSKYKVYFNQQEQFLNSVYTIARLFLCPLKVVSFEELYDSNSGPENFVEAVTAELGLNLERIAPRNTRDTRQDKSLEYKDKVSNWDYFFNESKTYTHPKIGQRYNIRISFFRAFMSIILDTKRRNKLFFIRN